jgi:uncharacterized protein
MFLNHIPAMLRILAVFIIILYGIQKKLSLGSAFLIGSVVLGLLFAMNPWEILQAVFTSLLHPKTLALSAVVCLILVLSHSMEAAGQMKRLLDRFQGVVRHPGLKLIIFPAIIGLLPMPGGAIFSAPMVKDLGERRGLSGAQLSYVNYWFRHIWEYWWPLYPGVLLTTTMAGLNLWVFVLCLFPVTVVATAAGYWPIREALNREETGAAGIRSKRTPVGPFLRELSPILTVIILGLGSGLILTRLMAGNGETVSKELGLILALLVAIARVWRSNHISAKRRWSILRNPKLLHMFYMVAGILIFQGILNQSGAVEAISRELIAWQVPLAPITVLLPFIVGGVAGITIAFVGATFPILISLVETYGQGELILSYMMLALVGGFAGVLLSPLHLCLLLSNGYFDTPLRPVYRYLWVPCLALVAAAALYFLGLHAIR